MNTRVTAFSSLSGKVAVRRSNRFPLECDRRGRGIAGGDLQSRDLPWGAAGRTCCSASRQARDLPFAASIFSAVGAPEHAPARKHFKSLWLFRTSRRDRDMAPKKDFTEILIRQGVLSTEQVAEAKRLAKSTGKKLQDAHPDARLCLGRRGHAGRGRRSMASTTSICAKSSFRPRSSNWCPNRSPAKMPFCRWPRRTARCG